MYQGVEDRIRHPCVDASVLGGGGLFLLGRHNVIWLADTLEKVSADFSFSLWKKEENYDMLASSMTKLKATKKSIFLNKISFH